jgi:hypothetical protein
MEKKQQKTSSLALRKETPPQLEESKLQGVTGGARLWKPGYEENATPIDIHEDQP